uniref:Uncharacterized protein n=1 Tax=Arundo donax TaxID=35708 RepID=A0A0A9F5W6_ARUDO
MAMRCTRAWGCRRRSP